MFFIKQQEVIQQIIDHYLFSGFTEATLNPFFLTHRYVIRKYKKDQIIHLQNERCDGMDIIQVGQVSVQNLDENGNILVINVFHQGDILGANLLFSTRNHYPMTVVAQSEVLLLQLNRELILDLCQANRGFMIGLMTEISDRTLILTDKINAISLKSIRRCIIDFLNYEFRFQKNSVIRLPLTKKELAEKFGIQRSSLSRELNKMRNDGLIEFDSRSITIKELSIIAQDINR